MSVPRGARDVKCRGVGVTRHEDSPYVREIFCEKREDVGTTGLTNEQIDQRDFNAETLILEQSERVQQGVCRKGALTKTGEDALQGVAILAALIEHQDAGLALGA